MSEDRKPNHLSLEIPIRLARGQAAALWSAVGETGEDMLASAAEALNDKLGEIDRLWNEIHQAGKVSVKPDGAGASQPVFDEEGYYRALSSLEVLHAYLVNEDKSVDSARLSFVIDAAVKELQRSVVI